jgi:ATP-dependent DNA helicase RecG
MPTWKTRRWWNMARAVAEDMLRTDPVRAEAHLQRWLGGREELLK